MDKIKIGIVGAGGIAEYHAKEIEKNNDCEIIAVCDLAKDRAEMIAGESGARVYTDYKQMAESESLDAVILNLPHFLHKEVSVYFLERRVSVLVEKPMAINVEECNEMIETAQKNNAYFAVGHVQRYYKSYQKVKEIIKSGELGKLSQMIEIRNTDYFEEERPKWFLDKKLAGGGIVMNYMAHTLDKFLYITGLDVKSISAKGNNFLTQDNIESTAQVLLEYEGGVSAMCSYCGNRVCSQYETYFYFTDGAVKVVDGETMYISKNGAPFNEVCIDKSEIFKDQIIEFIKLCRGEKSCVVTPEYGRKIIAVIEDAINQI